MNARWMLLGLLAATTALADDLPPPPPDGPLDDEMGFREGDAGRPPPQQRPEGEFRRGPGGPPVEGPFIDRLMERIRQNKPEEYQRLQQLRASDPAAFRDELQRRLKREVLNRLRKDRPQVAAALDALPQQDREWIMGQLRGPGGGPGGPEGQGGPGEMMQPPASPQIAAAEQQTHQLVNAYRKAATDDEREKLRGDVRANLAQLFDLRQQARAQDVQKIEDRVGKLRQSLDARQSHRDEIIDRRLRELTEGDQWAW